MPSQVPLHSKWELTKGDWSDVQRTLYQLELVRVQEQKDRLAGLIRPLISGEALRLNYKGELPSDTDMVQQLISRMAGKCTRPANGPEEALKNLIGLKTFLHHTTSNANVERFFVSSAC